MLTSVQFLSLGIAILTGPSTSGWLQFGSTIAVFHDPPFCGHTSHLHFLLKNSTCLSYWFGIACIGAYEPDLLCWRRGLQAGQAGPD